jgi:hypothetical protein
MCCTVLRAAMIEKKAQVEHSLDLRHIGRVNDKEMPIEAAGMEMAKPGLPDLRRRKYTVPLPGLEPPGAIDPPQTPR